MSNFSEQLEHLISSRAEIINLLNQPNPAEGNDLDRITGQKKSKKLSYDVPGPNNVCWPDEKAAAYSVILPPLESFMEVPEQIRKEQFFSTFTPGDILVGYVSAVQETGLVITLLACDNGPRRDFEDLKITGFCPLRQLPKSGHHGNPLDSFQIDDKVRCHILDIISTGRLILSMHSKHANKEVYGDVKYGVITDEELPLHYKKLLNLDNKTFEECLESTPQFHNPDGIFVLSQRFGLPRSSTCSLLSSFSSIKIPPNEMCVELRRAQLRALSMKKVQNGVKFFKEGKNVQALQCYNFAIEIENTNPDAYVARGALHASGGSYPTAIEDLDKALSFKPNHANAKNYMGQTLVAYANELRVKEPKKAIEMVRKAIKMNRKNNDARDFLNEMTGSSNLSDEDLEMEAKVTQRERNARAWSGGSSPGNKKHRPGLESPEMLRNKNAENLENDSKSSKHDRIDESPIEYEGRYKDRKKSDYSKLVITKDRSGRQIQCSEDNNNNISNGHRGKELQIRGGGTRRVFTPPKDAKVGEDGTMTKYQNVNDLPTSSKVLQERVQAKLAAIEKRHRGDKSDDEDDQFSDDGGHMHHNRNNIWVPPSQYDKRGRGNFRGRDRNDNFRSNNRDFRSRPYNNNNGPGGGGGGNFRQWEDRRRGGGGYEPRGGFRRGGNMNRSYQNNRSHSRRSDSRSRSKSMSMSPSNDQNKDRSKRDSQRNNRSRGYEKRSVEKRYKSHKSHHKNMSSSGSSRSSSRHSSPLIPKKRSRNNNGKNSGVSRAVLESQDLPSLAKVDRIAKDDATNMEEVNNFVAELKARRQAAVADVLSAANPAMTINTNIGPQVMKTNDMEQSESETDTSSSEEESEEEDATANN